MEKAESNHLTASSTWVSNQQTRTVGTDWQVYCLELIKNPTWTKQQQRKKKIKNLKKYLHLPGRSFALGWRRSSSWLVLRYVYFYQDVHLSTELCFGSQTRTLDRYREVTLGSTQFPRTGRAPSGKPGALPACAATPWCLSLPIVPSAHHRKGQLLSLCSSALVSYHESPVTQGGILKLLAVKIGNKSLPFSLLEPSFLSHEKDGF